MLISDPQVRGEMLTLPTASSGERRNHPSEWEGTQTLIQERHAHRWPSLVRGAVLALPMRSSKSGELIPQSEGTQTPRRERHAHKWPSMVRGAMLARPTRRATYHRAENSFVRMRGELRRSEGSGLLIDDPLDEGSKASSTSTSSGGRRTHSSEWEEAQTLRRERYAHRWPSRWGEQS